MISVVASKLNLTFVWGIEFGLVLVLGSKVTSFRCGGSKLTVCGPKLNCFERHDRLTCFCVVVVVGIDSAFVCGPQIAWFLCEHRNWLCFRLGGPYWLDSTWHDFSSEIGIDLLCVWGSKTTLFLYLDRNRPGFCEMMFDRKYIWCLDTWMSLACSRRPLGHRWLTWYLSGLSLLNLQNRSGREIPIWAELVAQ